MTTTLKDSMNAQKEEVARVISEAFAGVTLGDGFDLWWGQVLDDWSTPESIANYRANHESTVERLDWRRILVEDLYECHSSLSFFDAAGMRFHLPAFLLAELRGEMDNSAVFSLTYLCHNDTLDDFDKKQFATLDAKQRMAVRAFLLYAKDDPNHEFDRPSIEKALSEYWVAV